MNGKTALWLFLFPPYGIYLLIKNKRTKQSTAHPKSADNNTESVGDNTESVGDNTESAGNEKEKTGITSK